MQEYEEIGRGFKINGYYYTFRHEFKSKKKYYVCSKLKSQKCRGSITISPNHRIIKRVEHTCQCQDQISEEVYEYEESGRSFKINGHYYHFTNESKKKNKFYLCNKRKGQQCRGSITISPNRQIIKRIEHSCQSQNQILEEVHEFEETGGRFKINGYFYNFNNDSRLKNKYYQCFKRNSQKCRGSITISPNGQIIKRVEHTCQCQDQILEEVHEYEEKGRRLKINGHNYNLKNESMKKNKYYVCNKMNTQKCRGSIIISPNRQIIKRVGHTCQSQNQI